MSPEKKAKLLPIRIVVASPSDVKAERKSLDDIVEFVNQNVAPYHDLYLEISKWEKDAYAGFHADGPQGLIDAILNIEDCDIFVGIFWTRFGTPVKDAKSGTEHEFRLAYEAWKEKGRPQIMFYFNQKAYTPKSSKETIQWTQVMQFKENFPKEGLWCEYNGKSDFEEQVRNQLSALIRKSYPKNKDKLTSSPGGESPGRPKDEKPQPSDVTGKGDVTDTSNDRQRRKRAVEELLDSYYELVPDATPEDVSEFLKKLRPRGARKAEDLPERAA